MYLIAGKELSAEGSFCSQQTAVSQEFQVIEQTDVFAIKVVQCLSDIYISGAREIFEY